MGRGSDHPEGTVRDEDLPNSFNLAVAAVRYSGWFDWAGREADLAWWQGWGERAAQAHSVSLHEAVVREAMAWEPEAPLGDDTEPPVTDGPEGPKGDEPPPATDGGDTDETEPGDDTTDGGDEPDEDEPTEGGDEPTDDGEPTDEGGDDLTPREAQPKAVDGEDVVPDLPMCPVTASRSGSEASTQSEIDALTRSRAERDGTRHYGNRNVYRRYQSQRGYRRGKASGEGTAFLSPTLGSPILP